MCNLKKYLVLKACAGLGNRLVTIFAAIKYCEKNNRTLIVDWRDGQFDVKGVDSFVKYFELTNIEQSCVGDINNWLNLKHSSDLFKNNRDKSIYELYKIKDGSYMSRLPYKLFFSESLRKMRRCWQPLEVSQTKQTLAFGSDLSDGHCEDVLYFVDFLPIINYNEMPYYIQTKSVIKERVRDFAQEKKLSEAVGVHVRNTDKKPTAEISKVLDHLKLKYRDCLIYLSTDSEDIENMFRKEFPELILFPKTMPDLHEEGLHQWALRNKKEELKNTIYEESVVEMFLLSKCKYLLYQGNSTFSGISKVYHLNQNNCYDWLKL